MATYNTYKLRRLFLVLLLASCSAIYFIVTGINEQQRINENNRAHTATQTKTNASLAVTTLDELIVKGRSPKTGYTREQFGNGWREIGKCTTRELVLQRDLTKTNVVDCKVYSGTLHDPYTDKIIAFKRGADTSGDIQIDHVVALSDAWQKGAQRLSYAERENFANDPLELLTVDGSANQQKSDSDAASWLPSNKSYRCKYVARQIAVKKKYSLWVTPAEQSAIRNVLENCPSQQLPS